MITGDHDKLQGIARNNVCAEHHTPLEVAWYGEQKCWVLRCGEGHYPDAVTRQLSLTELHRAGEELPSFIEDKIKLRARRKAMAQGKGEPKTEFALVPQTDLGTGDKLVPETVKALVEYAQKYHLDPERGHVVLMYGKPYITIDGYLYHASQTGRPYQLTSRPLKEDERMIYQIPEGAYAWLARVMFEEGKGTFTGIGIVTQEEMEATSKDKPGQLRSPVVAAHPQLLAQKRAEWQALRRAFPIGEGEEDKGGEVENG